MLQIDTVCCALPVKGSKYVTLANLEIYKSLLRVSFGSPNLDLDLIKKLKLIYQSLHCHIKALQIYLGID